MPFVTSIAVCLSILSLGLEGCGRGQHITASQEPSSAPKEASQDSAAVAEAAETTTVEPSTSPEEATAPVQQANASPGASTPPAAPVSGTNSVIQGDLRVTIDGPTCRVEVRNRVLPVESIEGPSNSFRQTLERSDGAELPFFTRRSNTSASLQVRGLSATNQVGGGLRYLKNAEVVFYANLATLEPRQLLNLEAHPGLLQTAVLELEMRKVASVSEMNSDSTESICSYELKRCSGNPFHGRDARLGIQGLYAPLNNAAYSWTNDLFAQDLLGYIRRSSTIIPGVSHLREWRERVTIPLKDYFRESAESSPLSDAQLAAWLFHGEGHLVSQAEHRAVFVVADDVQVLSGALRLNYDYQLDPRQCAVNQEQLDRLRQEIHAHISNDVSSATQVH